MLDGETIGVIALPEVFTAKGCDRRSHGFTEIVIPRGRAYCKLSLNLEPQRPGPRIVFGFDDKIVHWMTMPRLLNGDRHDHTLLTGRRGPHASKQQIALAELAELFKN